MSTFANLKKICLPRAGRPPPAPAHDPNGDPLARLGTPTYAITSRSSTLSNDPPPSSSYPTLCARSDLAAIKSILNEVANFDGQAFFSSTHYKVLNNAMSQVSREQQTSSIIICRVRA
ncbi:unnamed protein product [Cyclocybe aegerita]|uniref:Uncharacterized protein n=1 Tax=Cyclocybe aegerita TaxID=1973307 RepID=A0A8S0XSP9_CYCAE|nr:unnamed protein product [Cyclocybe aegerita]